MELALDELPWELDELEGELEEFAGEEFEELPEEESLQATRKLRVIKRQINCTNLFVFFMAKASSIH